MHLTRQDCLRFLGVTSLGWTLNGVARPAGAGAAEASFPSLRNAAAARSLIFGSDSDKYLTEAPQVYKDLFLRQCALYAPNLGWKHISPAADRYDLVREQPSIDFATSAGIRLTGAHLLWYEQVPDWFVSLRNAVDASRAIEQHASSLCGRYAGKVFAWNVVNEAIDPRDGRSDGLRNSAFSPEDFVIAFKAARIADPQALLVYNDFGLELDSYEHELRRRALLRLVDWLRQRGAPIDAVGLQSHLRTRDFRFNASKYRDFLREIAARGLLIIISELDVFDSGGEGDVNARDRMVADIYSQYLNAALDEPAVCAVVTWGLSDRYTWLTAGSGRNFARPDGLPTRPLPFDADLRPKPAFFAILNALKNAPEHRMRPVPSPPG